MKFSDLSLNAQKAEMHIKWNTYLSFHEAHHSYSLKIRVRDSPSSSCCVDTGDERQRRGDNNGGWNGGTLYAGDWSVLDFWVRQVMGEIVSAAQLINHSAGSIYLCLRQSCWEMGTVKWESTACLSSPQLPSGHFTPTATLLSKATCEEKLINIKQVESRLPLPLAFFDTIPGVVLMYFVRKPD